MGNTHRKHERLNCLPHICVGLNPSGLANQTRTRILAHIGVAMSQSEPLEQENEVVTNVSLYVMVVEPAWLYEIEKGLRAV